MPNSVKSMRIHAVPICFFGNDTAICGYVKEWDINGEKVALGVKKA